MRSLGLALLVIAAACGDEARAVQLERIAPAADPECGAPIDARTLRVAAVGDFPRADATARSVEIGIGEPLAIDSFPPETRALEVEVLGAGGALRTIGRTLEFDGAELEEGDVIPVFMAPPNGVCPTGPPARSRSFPLVATSGDEVVVVGGFDGDGLPVTRPEVYHHRSGSFTEIVQDTYGDSTEGLAGASLTALSDGRLLLAGGPVPAFQVYDPESRRFSEPPNLLTQPRAFHAAVALDEHRVFFAGGCTEVENRRCVAGTEVATTAILDVDTGIVSPGPALSFLRVGGRAFLEPDGGVLLVGGVDGAGGAVLAAERIDPQLGGAVSELISGAAGQGSRLVSGAVITAFAPPGAAASGDGSAIAPGGDAGTPLVSAPPRLAPTLTTLESGRVLAFGGGEPGVSEAALLAPLEGRFSDIESVPLERRRGHVATRLPDGTVLIVGGETADGDHLGDALIFRPELLGPMSGVVTINFADDSQNRLIPRDLQAITSVAADGNDPTHIRFAARATDEGLPGEWAIIGGPLLDTLQLEMTASAEGGLAILNGFEEPTTYRVVLVERGAQVRLVQVRAGVLTPFPDCVGEVVMDADLDRRLRWAYRVDGDSIHLDAGGRALLDCEGTGAPPLGRVGVAPLGADGEELSLFQLTVER